MTTSDKSIYVLYDGKPALQLMREWNEKHPEEAARIRKEGEEEVAAEIAAEKAAKANRKK